MSLASMVLLIVPLIALQLNVLAAEAFIGNSRSWNARDLNFPRRTQPDAVVQPIHSIPRPLPKPIEVARDDVPEEISTVPAITRAAYIEENQPPKAAYESPTGRSYQLRGRQFNFQRRPVSAIQPATGTQRPITIAPPPIAVATAPASIAPEPVHIISEPEATLAPLPETTLTPQPVPLEEPTNPDDIEVIVVRSSPAPSTMRPKLRNNFNMARPIPNPISNGVIVSQPPKPAPQPEIMSSPAPIRSITILNNEPEPVPEDPIVEVSTPKAVELTLPTSIDPPTTIAPSRPIGVLSIAEPLTREMRIDPKLVRTELEEPAYIKEEDEPEIVEIITPVETPQPTTILVEEYQQEPEIRTVAQPGLTNWRRRRPVTRTPEIIPRPLPGPTPMPTPPRAPLRPNILKVTEEPATLKPVPLNPAPERPSPSFGKTLIPPRPIPKPVPSPPVKPIPHVKPTIPPSHGKSVIPPSRATTQAPVQLMDYHCTEVNAFYAISNECDSYVECQSYTAMMNTCPDGLHFNSRAVWPEYPCAYPSEVQCANNSIRQNAQPTEQCPRQYGFFALSDSDCSRYIICQEGIATVMDCPPGLVFNADTSTCDWPENVPSCKPEIFRGFNCPAPPLEEDGSPSDMIFKYRYGQSCREYVACQRGHPRFLSCDPGLAFDEEAEVCVDAEYVVNCRA